MDDTEKRGSSYMTAGEIAAKAGVTIRTIQYYDQKGLLHPSARGSRNLRLYTGQDLERLYQILCCKFIGMSLDEIRQLIDDGAAAPKDIAALEDAADPEAAGRKAARPEGEKADRTDRIREKLKQRIREEEQVISESIRNYALLKNLESYTEEHEIPDWSSYSDLIGYLQEKWRLIWELNRFYEGAGVKDPMDAAGTEMKEYFSLVATTIRLMREGVDPGSEEAAGLAEMYRQIIEREGRGEKARELKELRWIDPESMKMPSAEYFLFWEEIKKYLRAVKKSHLGANQETKQR